MEKESQRKIINMQRDVWKKFNIKNLGEYHDL